MNIDEMHRLASWFADQVPHLTRLYKALLNPITHNANQPDKQPVEEQLNALIEYLAEQTFDDLSLEQLKMLSSLGVDVFIGREGVEYVERTVRTSNYDPATAVQHLNAAVQAISTARGLLAAYAEAVTNLGLGTDDAGADDGLITIRIGFQSDVAINNVADWKDSAKEWYDIIRGISMVCDEKPEDIKVIGAATGSIILIMAGTAAFTALLATITRHITTAAKEVIGVRIEIENLRQKKLLTKVVEAELRKLEKDKAEGAISTIEQLLEGKFKGKDGDVSVALTSSIKKLLTFSEKGGTVDFVSPEEVEESEGEPNDDGVRAALIEARAAIREYQGERESLKLLSDGTKGS